VHLAGESLSAHRWTEAQKARIRDSRTDGTRLIAEGLAQLERPPRVLVSASAVGYYGDAGAAPLDESAPPGEGFLPEVCQAWEEAASPARARGLRVVNARLGVVLSPAGGALAKMLPAFRLGAGGPIGSGEQVMSWIALDDVLYAILRLIIDPRLEGPVNLTAPLAVTQRELAATLGAVLHRPSRLPLPAAAVRVMFGELGEAVLLGGARVQPRRLSEVGFAFTRPRLEDALRHLLGRAAQPPALAVVSGRAELSL
jgi:uncharacterized protein (TIGR01777 family)